MSKRNSLSGFLVPFICVVSFFLCIFVNVRILEVYLASEDLSFTYFDRMAFLKMLGYVLATIFSIMLITWLSFFRGVIIALPLYYLSCFCIIYLDTDIVITMFYFVIYGASALMIALLLVDKVFEKFESNILNRIILVISGMITSHVLVIYLNIFVIDRDWENVSFFHIIIANIIPLFVFLGIVFKFENYRSIRIVDGYNFNIVIKNMELEVLVAFSMFYVIMSINNGFEVFSLSHFFQDISTEVIKLILVSSVVLSVVLSKITIPNFNEYKINIICLISLIILFLSLPVTGYSEFLLSINLLLIGIMIGILFISSISILTKKFEGINISCALSIYALAASIGYYCGYITIDTSENTLGDDGFLISICFVLVSLLLYYLYLLKKIKII